MLAGAAQSLPSPPLAQVCWPQSLRFLLTTVVVLMHRSSKAIDKTAPERTVWRWWATPDPRAGVAIELGSGESRDVRDIVGVSEGLAGERFAAEEPPPPLDEVEPGGADRNEGLLDPRMRAEPVADGATAVAREIVGDEVQISLAKGVVQRLQ